MDEKKTTKGRGFSSPLMMAISLIAASVGTGNIWRFPRVMATNGGSTINAPVTIAESDKALAAQIQRAVERAVKDQLRRAV